MTAPHAQSPTGASRVDQQPAPENASTGQLIGQLTEQISRLVRDEVRLAQAEVTQMAKRLRIGAGRGRRTGRRRRRARRRRPAAWPSG